MAEASRRMVKLTHQRMGKSFPIATRSATIRRWLIGLKNILLRVLRNFNIIPTCTDVINQTN